MPNVAVRRPFRRSPEKEPALEQIPTTPTFQLFVGGDIAYRTFTAATLAGNTA